MKKLLKEIANNTEPFPNIDRSNNCFSYLPSENAPWFDIIIPEGSYHVEDINEFIH